MKFSLPTLVAWFLFWQGNMEDEMAKLQLELKVVIVILQHSDQDVATTEHKLMNFYES